MPEHSSHVQENRTPTNNSLALFKSLCQTRELDVWEGWQETYSDNIRLFCTTETVKCEPMIYDPGLVITMVGEKKIASG